MLCSLLAFLDKTSMYFFCLARCKQMRQPTADLQITAGNDGIIFFEWRFQKRSFPHSQLVSSGWHPSLEHPLFRVEIQCKISNTEDIAQWLKVRYVKPWENNSRSSDHLKKPPKSFLNKKHLEIYSREFLLTSERWSGEAEHLRCIWLFYKDTALRKTGCLKGFSQWKSSTATSHWCSLRGRQRGNTEQPTTGRPHAVPTGWNTLFS